MGITQSQQDALMRPLNASRVAKRKQAGMQLSYVEAWDVKAHLTRIFGFCNWDSVVSDVHLVGADQVDGKWTICYQATVTITIRDENGQHLCTHAEAAVGTSTQGRKGEALDMALKTAESDALKRACINLGTQFGLSLYNNGSLQDVVMATLVNPNGATAPTSPVKAPVTDAAPEPAPGAVTSPEALEVIAKLGQLVDLEPRLRITEVAVIKTQHKDLLQTTFDLDGKQTTIARFADLVAAGRFSDKGGETDGSQG